MMAVAGEQSHLNARCASVGLVSECGSLAPASPASTSALSSSSTQSRR